MKKFNNTLVLITALAGSQAQAQFNMLEESIMMDSLTGPKHQDLMPVADEMEDIIQITSETKNRSQLLQNAALAAAASYNPQKVFSEQSQDIRNQDNDDLYEKLIFSGQEATRFNANIKKNPLLGDLMAHGEMDAGFVSYSNKCGKATITIAYHGTECFRDLATDANALKKADQNLISGGYIHSGFRNRYMESRDQMLAKVQNILTQNELKADEVDFVVTGHSLGGALATIAAVDLKKGLASNTKLSLVTFSSPRVFDKKGAQEAENILEGRAYRLWREKDPIPAVSLATRLGLGYLTGFKHVGKSMKLSSTVNLFSMENHAMDTLLRDAQSHEDVKFDTRHQDIWTKIGNTVKSISYKLNPKNWW